MMKRREFIALLGSATAIWPLAVRAQPSDRARRIGVLMGFAENDEVWQVYLTAFRQRLQALGWTAGRNVQIDYRFTGESTERMRIAAKELVAAAPDVIFVSTNPAVSALMQSTRSIPIVFTWVSDSVGSGFVASLAHPGARGRSSGLAMCLVASNGTSRYLACRRRLPPMTTSVKSSTRMERSCSAFTSGVPTSIPP